MKKLTAEKCREQIAEWERMMSASDIAVIVERHLQAYRIALPILEQQEQGDGWIEWGGGECPVADDQRVHVQFRDGEVINNTGGNCIRWSHKGYPRDIIAYRIIPEQPTNQNGEQ
jgi:hypothetical protein